MSADDRWLLLALDLERRCASDVSPVSEPCHHQKKGANMETWYYEVVSFDGDYANLKRTDIESDELKLVARALLPPEIEEGSKLKYEWMQYELLR